MSPRPAIRSLPAEAVSAAEVANLTRELRRMPQAPDEQRQAWLTRKRDLLERIQSQPVQRPRAR